MARNNKDFSGASDSAKGAESPIDHEGIAMGIIRSGQSPAQKMSHITNHPTMPTAMKNWALDTITKIHGGANAGVPAAPGANTPENRPSVTGGEAKPISMEEALIEQAASKRQAARSGASVPQTSRPGRAKEPTNRTRGVNIAQKVPAKDVEHGLRALHVHLATISNSLQKHASTPEEIASISETNGHLSNALTSLNKGAPLTKRVKLEYLEKDGTPKSKWINRQGEANEHYIDAMGHIENAAKSLSEDHVQRLAANASVSSEIPNFMLSDMRSKADSLAVKKPAKDWKGVHYTETGEDGKPQSKFIPSSELRNPKSPYSIKNLEKVGGTENTAVKKAKKAITPPKRVYKSAVKLGLAQQTVGVEPSENPTRRTSRTQRSILKFTGGKPTEGKTPTFDGSVGGKKVSPAEIEQAKKTPWNPALKSDPAKESKTQNRGSKGGAV
jgi:hypothetical protein